MKANLLLADFVQATSDGKSTVVGLGWSFINPANVNLGVLALIEVPWTATNQKHHADIQLLDSDGNPVLGPDGNPIQVGSDFEVGRPPGHPAGVPLNVPMPINVHGLQLQPSHRYEWVLFVDGDTDDDWRVGFCTRPIPPMQLAG